MSFKVKDLAMHVGLSGMELSTCGTWTRTTSGIEETCVGSVLFGDGQRGRGRNLSALKAQLRQAVARA
jgi:hypothetical protein